MWFWWKCQVVWWLKQSPVPAYNGRLAYLRWLLSTSKVGGLKLEAESNLSQIWYHVSLSLDDSIMGVTGTFASIKSQNLNFLRISLFASLHMITSGKWKCWWNKTYQQPVDIKKDWCQSFSAPFIGYWRRNFPSEEMLKGPKMKSQKDHRLFWPCRWKGWLVYLVFLSVEETFSSANCKTTHPFDVIFIQ